MSLIAVPARPSGARAGTREGVALRLVDLDADGTAVARAEACLAPAELARARRGTPAVHRRRVLLRAALREAVADHLGTAPGHVPIATTAAGRPYVPGAPGLDVNCSAGGTLGVVVLAVGRRVGVDVEAVTPWSDDVLDEGWLTPRERTALAGLPAADRPLAAARVWTRKEAVLKARGSGLLDSPQEIVPPAGPAGGSAHGWEIDDVPVPSGWVASLAIRPLEGSSA